jgi:S-adenosylmethionine decarboxylase
VIELIHYTYGIHIICDMWHVSSEILNDIEFLTKILTQAANLANMTIIGSQSYQFQPQGVTCILMLAESHLSIHSYPESGYCAIDCYTCGNSDPQVAIDFLREMLNPRVTNEQVIIRGNL